MTVVECDLCGKDTPGYGVGKSDICLECFKNDPGLVRDTIEDLHWESSKEGPDVFFEAEFERDAFVDGIRDREDYLENQGISSPEDAVERFREKVKTINTRDFIAELRLHDLVGEGLAQGMGQDLRIPPRMVNYLAGLCTTVPPGGEDSYSFYELLRYGTDVLVAYSQFTETQSTIPFGPITSSLITGGFAHDKQLLKVAELAYKPHSEKMKELIGFNIQEGLYFSERFSKFQTKYVNEMFTDELVAVFPEFLYMDFLTPNRLILEDQYGHAKDMIPYLEQISLPIDLVWIESDSISKLAPNGKTEEFGNYLDRMSHQLGKDIGFRTPDDHNPLDEAPLIRYDGELLMPQLGKIPEVLANSFYYDLISDTDYEGRFTNDLGTFVEEWVAHTLAKVIPEEDIFRNLEYPEGESDVVALIDQTLLLFECKSKKLRAESYSGGEVGLDSIKEDVSTGVGRAYEQARNFLEHLESGGTVEISNSRSIRELSDADFSEAKIIVTLRDTYDMVGTTGFYKVLEFESRPPMVVDIFDLDTICRHLDTGRELADYITRRQEIMEEARIQSPDEIDYLDEYLRSGLQFPDRDDNPIIQITNPGNRRREIYSDIDRENWWT